MKTIATFLTTEGLKVKVKKGFFTKRQLYIPTDAMWVSRKDVIRITKLWEKLKENSHHPNGVVSGGKLIYHILLFHSKIMIGCRSFYDRDVTAIKSLLKIP